MASRELLSINRRALTRNRRTERPVSNNYPLHINYTTSSGKGLPAFRASEKSHPDDATVLTLNDA
jgi:hypothetical protein